MFYAYDHRLRRVASWDDVDEIERLSHFHQKAMFTVFFNGTWEYKIVILPEGQKVSGACFIESVLRPLAEMCHPQGRGTRAVRRSRDDSRGSHAFGPFVPLTGNWTFIREYAQFLTNISLSSDVSA
jgi:hypothetical protein